MGLVVAALLAALPIVSASAGETTNETAPVVRRSIGVYGSGIADRGALDGPGQVSVGPDGDVYVASAGSDKVVRFDPDGTFVRQYGLGVRGSAPGELHTPWGVAVGPSGDVYVADSGNHRVVRFASDGTYLSTWGSQGSAVEQFQHPEALAVGPDGDVWVLEKSRVQRFDADGTFDTAWGNCCTGPAVLVESAGIALGPDGSVFVTSSTQDKVQKFSPAGALLSSFGTSGTGPGQFLGPKGIAVTTDGSVYVGERNASTNRVQRFDPVGDDYEHESSFPAGGQAQGVGVSPAGEVFVSTTANRVKRFSAEGAPVTTWGEYGDGLARFDGPSGVAVLPDGGLVVADRRNHRVVRSGSDLYFGSATGTSGTALGEFQFPGGVAVGPGGRIYVADTANHRVQRLAPDGSADLQWGSFGSGRSSSTRRPGSPWRRTATCG